VQELESKLGKLPGPAAAAETLAASMVITVIMTMLIIVIMTADQSSIYLDRLTPRPRRPAYALKTARVNTVTVRVRLGVGFRSKPSPQLNDSSRGGPGVGASAGPTVCHQKCDGAGAPEPEFGSEMKGAGCWRLCQGSGLPSRSV
jgi:hypothetical protein